MLQKLTALPSRFCLLLETSNLCRGFISMAVSREEGRGGLTVDMVDTECSSTAGRLLPSEEPNSLPVSFFADEGKKPRSAVENSRVQ